MSPAVWRNIPVQEGVQEISVIYTVLFSPKKKKRSSTVTCFTATLYEIIIIYEQELASVTVSVNSVGAEKKPPK